MKDGIYFIKTDSESSGFDESRKYFYLENIPMSEVKKIVVKE